MRKLVALQFVLLFVVASFAADKLPPLPSQKAPISTVAWANYSRTIIKELFPTRPDLSEKPILFLEEREPFAISFPDYIKISTGLIRETRDENEFSVMLAHEIGHELLRHHEVWALASERAKTSPEIPDLSGEVSLRLNEVEADFVSIVTTGNLKNVYDSFRRYIDGQTVRAKSPVPYGLKKQISFRLEVMRNMLKANNEFAPVVRAEPLPKSLPSWKSDQDVWEKFSRKTLVAMYPNYKDRIDKLFILTNEKENAARGGCKKDQNNPCPNINLNLPWLSEVIRNPEEFALLLGHEFGHVVTARDYNLDYLDTMVVFTEYEVELRQQLEADIFGTLPVVGGACTWADVLERIVESIPKYSEEELSYIDKSSTDIRVERLRLMCKSD